jgi:hypothetical protein
MTIRFLAAYGIYPQNAIVTLDAGTEAGLVAAGQATTTVTGGVPYLPAVAPIQPLAPAAAIDGFGNIVGIPGLIAKPVPGAQLAGVSGAKLIDIGALTLIGPTSASINTSGLAKSASGKNIVIAGNGAGTEQLDFNVPTPFALASAPVSSIGFWAYKPMVTGGKPTAMTVYWATDNSFAKYATTTLVVYPGMNFYNVPLPYYWKNAGAGLFPSGGTVSYIRIKANANGQGAFPFMAAGDTIQIGDFYINQTASVPTFMFDYDVNTPDFIIPTGNVVAGADGVPRNHSFCSFLATYGFSANLAVVTGQAAEFGNVPNTMQPADMQFARDAFGAAPINHGHYHPQSGDMPGSTKSGSVLLGPAGFVTSAAPFTCSTSNLAVAATNDLKTILADMDLASDALRRWGFAEGGKHFVLSQGAYDISVTQALELRGFRSVRGVVAAYVPQSGLMTACDPNGGIGSESPARVCGVSGGASVFGAEGSVATANIDTFIANVMAVGGIGRFYTHNFNTAPTLAAWKYLCDKLKALQAAGAVRIQTLY